MSPIDLKAVAAARRLNPGLLPPVGCVVRFREDDPSVFATSTFTTSSLKVVGHSDTRIVARVERGSFAGQGRLVRPELVEVIFLPDNCPPLEEWRKGSVVPGPLDDDCWG